MGIPTSKGPQQWYSGKRKRGSPWGRGTKGSCRTDKPSKQTQQWRAERARADLKTAIEKAGSRFGNVAAARGVAIGVALQRKGGKTSLDVDHTQIGSGRVTAYWKMRVSRRLKGKSVIWDPAQTEAGISYGKSKKLARDKFGDEKGFRPCDNKIVHARHTLNEALQEFLPITPTAGKGGHEVSIFDFYSLVIPAYYIKLKALHFPPDGPDPQEDDLELLREAVTHWAF
ncbi:hypothetical protein CYMTET_45017 [Cymbomonas tetramitiformis]|uniref:Uncharacterized protein n=1 Tax=Cymbomonas tetramitiformis TaxID=36881 RepID=A0AAE0C096_9CHLO|nr:hypothetical protein CYMTET_45017 [Cymbomonas tetramitiformis]